MALSVIVSYDDIWRHIVSFLPPIRNPTPRYIALYLQVAIKCNRAGIMFAWNLPINPTWRTYRLMIRDGCVEGIKWLQSLNIEICTAISLDNPNVDFGNSLIDIATSFGQLECLKYVWNIEMSYRDERMIYWMNDPECVKYIRKYQADHIAMCAAKNGHLNCLRWIMEHDKKYLKETGTDACASAASGNHLDCLEYVYFSGYGYWDEHVCYYAAAAGSLDCLKFAHTHKCPWTEKVYINAIKNNHFDCVEYALQNGCPMQEYIYNDEQVPAESVALAAIDARFELFKYLIEHGCPHGFRTAAKAIALDRVDILDYLMEHGIELDSRICNCIATHHSSKCNAYAKIFGRDPLGKDYDKYSTIIDVVDDDTRFSADESFDMQESFRREAMRGYRKENNITYFDDYDAQIFMPPIKENTQPPPPHDPSVHLMTECMRPTHIKNGRLYVDDEDEIPIGDAQYDGIPYTQMSILPTDIDYQRYRREIESSIPARIWNYPNNNHV